jgi:hypothetical protein
VSLIYSKFIEGGLVPMALALEEMGFQRYGEANYMKSLFKEKPVDFILNPISGFFKIDNSMSKEIEVSSVNQADSLFFDKRFANNPQFKFLPPVVETTTGSVEIAEFNNIKEYNSLTYEDLKSEIFGTDANPIKQRIDIQVQDTSLDNDMVAQFFEVSPNGLTKLDAVDFGEAFDSTDREHPRKRIVFFGKVFLDDTQTATFINLFTVVFD